MIKILRINCLQFETSVNFAPYDLKNCPYYISARAGSIFTALDNATHKIMHINSSIPRLYIPRRKGGSGLQNLHCLYNRIFLDTAHIAAKGRDYLLKIVSNHEMINNEPFLYKATEQAREALGLNLNIRNE